MKLSSALAAALALALPAYAADYFSEGWKPGQPAAPYAPTPVVFDPAATPTAVAPGAASTGSYTDMLLSSGPVVGLFSKIGVNITEKMEAARIAQENMWDRRIPLITDDNWRDLLVNEEFASEEEEKSRVWFLIITGQMSQPEGLSKFADKFFDKAYNLTLENNDLPNVRWGRVDYLNVTELTTKWIIWQAPFLVVATDRAQTLRFYKASNLRMDPEMIHKFLTLEAWRDTPPWSSPYAPGGSREWLIDYFATAMTKTYDLAVRVPRWVMLLFTGMIGSLFIQLFHRNDTDKYKQHMARQKAAEAAAKAKAIAEEPKAPAPAPATNPSTKSKKKGGKK